MKIMSVGRGPEGWWPERSEFLGAFPGAQVVECFRDEFPPPVPTSEVDVFLVECGNDDDESIRIIRSAREASPLSIIVAAIFSDEPEGEKSFVAAGADACWFCSNRRQGGLVDFVEVLLRCRELERLVVKTEEELAFFRGLIESATEAVIVVDKSQTIVFFNSTAEKLFHCPVEEAIGQSLDGFIPEKFRASHAVHLREFGANGKTFRRMGHEPGELFGLRRDGTVFPFEAAISKYKVGGEYFLAAFLRDVTEKRVLCEQFMQSRKMETIGRLAGGVVHDFNNLLTVMRGYCHLLLPDLDPSSASFRRAGEIQKAVLKAADLTRQLLTFVRLEPNSAEVVSLSRICLDLEPLLQRLIGEDVRLKIEAVAKSDHIKVNRVHLDQIILNLAANGRDAMPTGGILTMRVTRRLILHPTVSQPETILEREFVCLSVQDTGLGMDEETKRRIFQPFFTTKPLETGTGLGLSTVRQIVEGYDGFIHVESRRGVGTTFHVFLPAWDDSGNGSSASAELDRPASSQIFGSERVLLVEDEPAVRKMTAELLRSHGFTVIEASNGGEALTGCECSREPIDILLTDCIMPVMGGVQLAEHLLLRHPRMKVILMSGYFDRTQQDQGGFTYLEKPFPLDLLIRTIRAVLDADSETRRPADEP